MKRYKLERRGIIRLVLTGLAWTVAFLISLLLIGCQTIDIRGVTVPYVNETLRWVAAVFMLLNFYKNHSWLSSGVRRKFSGGIHSVAYGVTCIWCALFVTS